MNVSLTPELEAFVHNRVESGRYISASEVIRESLRLLEEKEWIRERRDEAIRKEVLRGIEQMEKGEYITLNGDEELKKFFDDVKREGRERLKTSKR